MTVFDLLIRDEGTVDHVYFLNGIPHLGHGHNGITGPRLSPTVMRMILTDDVAALSGKMGTDVAGWHHLTDARQAVLISIAYQCGYAGFLGFAKMLHAIANADYAAAAKEIRNSTLAHQNVERTARLASYMETGTLSDR